MFQTPLSHLTVSAEHQERTVFVYNAAFGGITSGIGGIINRPKEVNWKKAFLKGLWQGGIGGLLNYTGKKTLYLSFSPIPLPVNFQRFFHEGFLQKSQA